jgi:hypothetical protein
MSRIWSNTLYTSVIVLLKHNRDISPEEIVRLRYVTDRHTYVCVLNDSKLTEKSVQRFNIFRLQYKNSTKKIFSSQVS